MIEEVFHIGSLSVSPFGVMLMLAFIAAYWQLARGLRQTGAGDADDASALLLWGGLGGFVGGKSTTRCCTRIGDYSSTGRGWSGTAD